MSVGMNVTEPTAGRVIMPLACIAVGVAGAAAVSTVISSDRPEAGITLPGSIPCPIHELTGLWCPGCGLTRATHHLFRGNLDEAMSLHLFVPLVLVGLVTLWFVWLSIALGRGVPGRVAAIRPRTYWISGAVLAAFTVVRNLPGFEALRGG